MSALDVPTDLHGHTLHSDGRTTPGEYVAFRAGLGMRVVAVADHDVFAGVRSAAATAQAAGVDLVPAAELTSVLHFGREDAEQIHVLAYFSPDVLADGRLERTALYRRGLEVQARWRDFVLAWVDDLPEADRSTASGFGTLACVPASWFPALQSMIDLLACVRPDLYDRFRRHHVRFWHEDQALFGWTPEELIDAIRADGAIDVVAHPVRYKDRDRLEQILAYATGVEVYTSRHAPKVATRFREYAETHGKLWTASSDDHQRGEYARPPCGTPVATLERIYGRALPPQILAQRPEAVQERGSAEVGRAP